MQSNHSSKGFIPRYIKFVVQHHVQFGMQLILSGSTKSLGEWNLRRGRKLRWKPGDLWTVTVRESHKDEFDKPIEFKFVVTNNQYSQFSWERGENRVINISLTQRNPSNEYVFASASCTWERIPDINLVYKVCPKRNSKALVVLGKKLLTNGSPSHILLTRMEFACKVFLEEYAKNSDLWMLVSGGRAQVSNKVLSEAEVMKDLAVQKGVKESQIILEDNALNTIENVLNTKELLEEHGIWNIIVITSGFHMERAKKLFQRLLGEGFQLEFKEDSPALSPEEKAQEEQTEKFMTSLLDEHLEGYLGTRFFENKGN